MTVRQSLRRRLLTLILGVVTAVWLVAGWRIYVDARHEVDEVYDASLARSARVLIGLLAHQVEEEHEDPVDLDTVRAELAGVDLGTRPALQALLDAYADDAHEAVTWLAHEEGQGPGHRYESELALIAKTANGTTLLRSPKAPDPHNPPQGYFDYDGDDGARWRLFSLVDKASDLRVVVGERIEVRRELVEYIVSNTLTPMSYALPVLAVLLWLAVGRGLRPLARLAAEVGRREPDALQPIPATHAPIEVRTLLDSLNGLFTRLAKVLQQERRFTADAAHELRTPLAALRAQAQVAAREDDPERRRQALDGIVQGVDRATHLVEQLLTLARMDAAAAAEAFTVVAIAPLLGELLAELADAAYTRGAELELDATDVSVRGDPAALRVLVRNLVDNAVRYGGTLVQVAAARVDARIVLSVTDDGPGIPPADRARALERFHRGESVPQAQGSGLGLSIVQRIAELHGAELRLEDAPGGKGLRVVVAFPEPR